MERVGVFSLLGLAAVAQTPTYATLDLMPLGPTLAAWDPHRARVLAVESGRTQWEWDGQRWAEQLGTAAPDIGTAPVAMACHRADRTWILASWHTLATWNGARWTLRTNLTGPAYGSSFALAYDEHRACLVAYDGTQAWEWHDGWVLPPQPTKPVGRADAGFAYDTAGRRCVLYGGSGGADCWAWDGSFWTQLQAAAPPGPRTRPALAYEEGAARLVLYGGQTGPQTTWALQGATWTQLATTRDPGERDKPCLLWDGTGMLLFGGNVQPDDTCWRLQNGDWQQLPAVQPTLRYGQQWAYDQARQCVVLFGGRPPATMLPRFGDTWTWDGTWRRHAPPVSPPARAFGGLAWSSANQAVLLFGGSDPNRLGDTWLWDGTSWLQLAPAVSPSPRSGMVLVPDLLGGVLLIGGWDNSSGSYLGDQWRWDGANWQQQTPPPPPSSHGWLGAHDPVRARVVIVARDPTGQVFEWDGTAWTTIPSPLVTNESVYAIGFRPDTGRVLLDTSQKIAEWDGTGWNITVSGQRVGSGNLLSCPRITRLLSYPGNAYLSPLAGLAVLTHTPATATRFGSGCALGSAPGLGTRDRPRPGAQAFQLVGAAITPQVPSFLVLGLAAQNVPLGHGCSQLVGTVLGTVAAVAGTP
ncbi:MAG: hypothetical protein FJ265_21880, partial [Planctomycetes bacterium]|nr:hypothetical protein [Planctomycetota bacterium]